MYAGSERRVGGLRRAALHEHGLPGAAVEPGIGVEARRAARLAGLGVGVRQLLRPDRAPQGEDGQKLQVIAEVLRIERNPGHPLAALQLLGETDEWKGLIWEPAAPRLTVPTPPVIAEEDEEDEDEEHGAMVMVGSGGGVGS